MQIDDNEVPLAVVDADEDAQNDGLSEIEDEETPLANAALAEGVWWSWIPVVGAVASVVEGYRRNKKSKEESGDTRDE